MITIINIEFCFFYKEEQHAIRFQEIIELPFTPFYGVILVLGDAENELSIELSDVNDTTTAINYYVRDGEFEINVKNRLHTPVEPYVLDAIVQQYENAGFKQNYSSDIDVMKAAMQEKLEFLNRNQLVRD